MIHPRLSKPDFDEKGLAVERVIREADIVVDSGRAGGGRMFVRVIHKPTEINRSVTGLGGRSYQDVVADLWAALKVELVGLGWGEGPELSEL